MIERVRRWFRRWYGLAERPADVMPGSAAISWELMNQPALDGLEATALLKAMDHVAMPAWMDGVTAEYKRQEGAVAANDQIYLGAALNTGSKLIDQNGEASTSARTKALLERHVQANHPSHLYTAEEAIAAGLDPADMTALGMEYRTAILAYVSSDPPAGESLHAAFYENYLRMDRKAIKALKVAVPVSTWAPDAFGRGELRIALVWADGVTRYVTLPLAAVR